MTKVISVENLSKQYDLGVIGTGTLTRDLNRWWARVRGLPDPYTRIGQKDAFERIGESILALDDVSFTVQQGEALGIIGRNGAGKSTLLKILSRVTAPTSGVVKVRGRIGSLLEVGTGFHPELTGRENVYLNGAILGMKKEEVTRKFDEIVDFSGVEKFIDTPVKRYSSGMYVRLAFAVAAHLDPDILIVDEVLAVGDAEFQKKCLEKMNSVVREGSTVLFVSHNMLSVAKLSKTGILLDHGKIVMQANIENVVEQYLMPNEKINKVNELHHYKHTGNGSMRFLKTWLEDENGKIVDSVFSGHTFSINVEYLTDDRQKLTNPYISFTIRDVDGTNLTDLWNQGAGYSWNLLPSTGTVKCTINKCPFNEGTYYYSLHCQSGSVILDHIVDAGKIVVETGDYFKTGKMPSPQFSKILIDQTWDSKLVH